MKGCNQVADKRARGAVHDDKSQGLRRERGAHGLGNARRPSGSGHMGFNGKRGIIVALVALAFGALVFTYPMVSNLLNQDRYGAVVKEQAGAVDGASDADLEAARQAAIAYNEKLLDSRTVVTDPFDPDTQRVTNEEYESVLNLAGDGVMGTITIPKIHVQMPIYHGTSSEVLQEGVGHLEETSVPVGGASTHCVLSGHTGLPSAKIFDNLDQLEVGDYFIITVLGEDLAYRVTSTEVVLPDETESLVIQPGKDLVTLVTCTPYGVNTHRLLVHAERCEVPEEWLAKGDADFPAGYSDPPDKALLPSVLLGLLLAAVIIGGYYAVRKLRERQRRGGRGGRHGRGGSRGHGRDIMRAVGGARAGASATGQVSQAPGHAAGVVPVRGRSAKANGSRGGASNRSPMSRNQPGAQPGSAKQPGHAATRASATPRTPRATPSTLQKPPRPPRSSGGRHFRGTR